MQQKTSVIVRTQLDQWLLSHASSLISYAQADRVFAASFAHHIQAKAWPKKKQVAITPPRYIRPATQPAAVITARWLLQSLNETAGTNETKSTLATWAASFEAPKDVLIGIVGIAIMGPTLGILEKKRKTKNYLRTIVDAAWFEQQTLPTLIEHIQTNNQRVIANEIRMAGGDLYKLHPDTAAWCLDEPLTKLYLANTTELAALVQNAAAEGLSHHTYRVDNRPVIFSVSPTVLEAFEQSFTIHKLE